MHRVIVCKMGRLGELRKIVDCQTSQLSDTRAEEPTQPTSDSQVIQSSYVGQVSPSCVISQANQSSNDGQENHQISDNQFIQSSCTEVNYLNSDSQVIQSSIESELNQSSTGDQYDHSASFVFNVNQNFEGVIFDNELEGQTLSPPQPLYTHALPTEPAVNQGSFRSRLVEEKKSKSSELLKYLQLPQPGSEKIVSKPEILNQLGPISH